MEKDKVIDKVGKEKDGKNVEDKLKRKEKVGYSEFKIIFIKKHIQTHLCSKN